MDAFGSVFLSWDALIGISVAEQRRSLVVDAVVSRFAIYQLDILGWRSAALPRFVAGGGCSLFGSVVPPILNGGS